MEEIFLLIAGFLVETLIPLVLDLILSILLRTYDLLPAEDWKDWKIGKLFAFSLLAAVLGGVSTFVLPALLFKSPIVQLLNLVIGPAIVGWIMSRFSRYRVALGKSLSPVSGFWATYFFVFIFLAARCGMHYNSPSVLFPFFLRRSYSLYDLFHAWCHPILG